jgi:V/A-type H+-transporting ATPase subunit E
MNKLQELTDKLYNEGLSKGQQEAEAIINQAKAEAEKILSEAKSKAKEIEIATKKQVAETMTNADAEIKLAGKQIISAIKQSIEDMVLTGIVNPGVKNAFEDFSFVRSLIKTATEQFNSHNSENFNPYIIVPKEQEKDIIEYLAEKLPTLMPSLEVIADSRIKSGFKIGSRDNGYYIGFTDEDFDNLFKTYLRPKISKLLFDRDI